MNPKMDTKGKAPLSSNKRPRSSTSDSQAPPSNKISRSHSHKKPDDIAQISKSFTELSYENDKSHHMPAEIIDDWRTWDRIQQLADFCGLSEKNKCFLESLHGVSNINISNTVTVQDYIIKEAQEYYRNVKNGLQGSGISWVADPTAAHEEDRIVSMYLHFVKIALAHNVHHNEKYLNVCKMFLHASPADIFHRVPNKDRDVSYEILDEIKADFDAYNSKSYIAPYTSLLGPSGIGKSYAIQHIARKGIYVVYANLGDHDSMTYPRRSLLADRIALFQYRSPLTIYSECYVAASMVNVEICKDLKITPIAFFDMQAKVEFRGLQRDLQKSLDSLYWKSKTNVDEQGHPRIRSTDYPDDDFNYRSYIDPGLKEYKTNAHRAISKSFKEANSAEYVTSQPSASEDKLQAIICFDEARALLDTEHRPEPERDMKFRALRRALRHQTKIGEDTDDKRFFALFLDTTGRVSDFSPPTRDDLSLRYVDPETLDLFPPLYKIHGWDLFAVDDEEGWRQLYYSLEPSNSVRRLAYMRRLGRPLWGALCSMLSPDEVQNFAMKKIFRGHDEQTMTEIEALALLSYRINFDVRLPSIAKELTAGYMLCISSIDKTRSLLKTFQSSEPMLALCSQQKMSLESDSRLQIVRTLYSSIPKGTINTGDIGEIVAALILLFSFDRALPQGTFIPMKLSQFLESLLPDKVREKFADCMTQKEDLKRLWNDGYVFFNHFWRMERGQKPGVPTLRTAFYRGAALFPPPRYEGCDIIIPVLLPTEKKEMSYIVIQVKNRGDDVLGSSVKNEARNDLKACLKDLPDTAHIGLMLALRSKIGEDAEIVYPLARHDQAPELRSSSKTPSGKYRFDDKNRVIAAIVGTSFDLYPGLVHPNDDRNKPSSSSDMLHILKALLELGGTSEDNSAYSAAYMPPSG